MIAIVDGMMMSCPWRHPQVAPAGGGGPEGGEEARMPDLTQTFGDDLMAPVADPSPA
jgi:hypothetical protein